MESLANNCLLEFKPDTLDFLRNQYGFNTLKRVNDAIDVLEDWISKQEHFVKKEFDRAYLERMLIYNKGSVEKCKKKLDKICTFRTLIPDFFSTEVIHKNMFFEFYSDALLSRMTPDYGRVHFMQIRGKNFETINLNNYCKYYVLVYNYIQMKDYCNHVSIIVHWIDVNVLDFVKALNVSEFRKTCDIVFAGFSMRIKAMYMVSGSKTIDAFVSIMKSLVGPKLGQRIHILKTMDSVYEEIPRELMPQDYGGKDKPLQELREDLHNELHSADFTNYRREMEKACTNEALRQKDKFNDEYFGLSGTFRTLSVD